jgi:long-chain acyl-CoA synthetase
MSMLASGSTVILLERFHPELVLKAIEHHRATAIWGTMSMYTKLLECFKRQGGDLSSLRVVSNGGEPAPTSVIEEFETCTGLRLLASYSTSETRPILVERPGSPRPPLDCDGMLAPGAEIFLEDSEGNEVPVGTPGHALLRSPGNMTEYYREPELTAERISGDGWIRTGDIIRRDDEGHYYVVGRQTEMIIRSGVNIAPAEVESALMAHPGVLEAAVVGIPDPRSGEAVCAYVIRTDGATVTEEELRAAVAGQLAAVKVPGVIEFRQSLPRTPTGKLDRRSLVSTSH